MCKKNKEDGFIKGSFDAQQTKKLDSRGNVLFSNVIVTDGQIAGTWKRTFKKNSVVMAVSPFFSLTDAKQQILADAAKRYAPFLGLPVDISLGQTSTPASDHRTIPLTNSHQPVVNPGK